MLVNRGRPQLLNDPDFIEHWPPKPAKRKRKRKRRRASQQVAAHGLLLGPALAANSSEDEEPLPIPQAVVNRKENRMQEEKLTALREHSEEHLPQPGWDLRG